MDECNCDDMDIITKPYRNIFVTANLPHADTEIGNGRRIRRRRGGRKKKLVVVAKQSPQSTATDGDVTVAAAEPTKVKQRNVPPADVNELVNPRPETTPSVFLCGIAADRNASYKSMMPTIVPYGAWQPYAFCRDLANIATGIAAVTNTISMVSARRSLKSRDTQQPQPQPQQSQTQTPTTNTTTTTSDNVFYPLITAPTVPVPTTISLSVSDRESIVVNLSVLEKALWQLSRNATAHISDGITSALIHLDNSEILGHGPLIPVTATRFDTDRSILTGQSHKSVVAASVATNTTPH